MKKILVIGAGDYQTVLIKRIKERGYDVFCVDKNTNAIGYKYATGYKCIDVMDFDGCLAYAKELNIDAVMTYGATLTLPTVAYIAEKLRLPAITPKTAEISKSKYKIKKKLFENGCNVKGDFFELHSVEDAKTHTFEFPCIIKPSDGSGSKGVVVVHNEDELSSALEYSLSCSRYSEVYTESFIDGEEYSVEAFVENSNVHTYAIVKTTFIKDENGNISYGHRTPSGLPEQTEDLIKREVEKAVFALNITLNSVNFDVIIDRKTNKPYIIDCGIRIGQNLFASHLVPLSRGVSVIDNTIDLALGNSVDAKPKYQKCVATRLLIYSPGIIKEIKPYDDLIGKHNILDIVLRKGAGDILRPYKEKSDTCGWVVTNGATPDEAEKNAQKAKELLQKYIIIEPSEVKI